MFPERLIEPGSLREHPRGVSFSVRLPWYRALPLSCVDAVSVQIDGVDVPADHLTFSLNGSRFLLKDLAPRYDVWWYVLDSAGVDVDTNVAVTPTSDISATIGLLIPYLPVDGAPLQIFESCTRSLSGQAA